MTRKINPATRQSRVIDIEWDGPYRFWDNPGQLESVSSLKGPTDYGVYQIYGGHPVYGNSALLYIGMAAAQEFGKRIPQEKHWLNNRDAGRVEVHVGRLAGARTLDDVWERRIRLAERLLIHAHAPPINVQKSLATLATEIRDATSLTGGIVGICCRRFPGFVGPAWTRASQTATRSSATKIVSEGIAANHRPRGHRLRRHHRPGASRPPAPAVAG